MPYLTTIEIPSGGKRMEQTSQILFYIWRSISGHLVWSKLIDRHSNSPSPHKKKF